jgi:hypothetical protein
MNHSEQLALHYLERMRALMADGWLAANWPSAMLMLALGLFIFVLLIVAAEWRPGRKAARRRPQGAAASQRWTSPNASRSCSSRTQ